MADALTSVLAIIALLLGQFAGWRWVDPAVAIVASVVIFKWGLGLSQECARQLIDLPKDWKRWATADREPIGNWTFGRATLLGDAAHPTLQYLAQGACMAMEDAVTLGEALRLHDGRLDDAFALYQRSRIARTARVVLSAREMGRIFHAQGVERLVRNELWRGRSPERFYDAMEWLYGWTAERCLAA